MRRARHGSVSVKRDARLAFEELLVLGRARVALEHPRGLWRHGQPARSDGLRGVISSIGLGCHRGGADAHPLDHRGVLVLVGAVWIGQGMGLFNGSGFMDNNRIWAVIGAVLVVGRRGRRLDRRQGPPAGLSQAAQVGSAGPAVTSLPWRARGSLSRLVSASSRLTMPASSRLR